MRLHSALLLSLVVVSAPLVADVQDDIVALERKAWKAWAAQDEATYGKTMTDDALLVAASGSVYAGKRAILADMAEYPCETKSFDFADPKVRMLSADVAMLTYRLTQDVSCKSVGKLAPKAFVTSIYVRQGNDWRWASYQETPLKK